MNQITLPLAHLQTRKLAWQGTALFALDNFTNLLDYLFHIYLARMLLPGDFAMVQTVNGVIVVLVTLFAVMQPVVARFITESRPLALNCQPSLFRYYFGWSWMVGMVLVAICLLAERPISVWLNVPVTAVHWSAFMLLLVVVRPVVAGMLQGQERFVAFGLVRLTYAVGRFVLAVLFLWLGMGAIGVIAAIPLGSLLALLLGLGCLGWAVWQNGSPLPAPLRQGFWLSVGAFIAFAAYMSLQTYDLVWVNRLFDPTTAGHYASAVLLRRILALLPSAVLVILYPRMVAQVKAGKSPDKLLVKTAVFVTAPALVLTAIYFLFGEWISHFTFGGVYTLNSRLLGWMGAAMVGYGLASAWLNLFLATRPWPFVGLLAGTAVLQIILFTFQTTSLMGITAVFALGGWILAPGGLLLYLFWLRPQLNLRF